DAGLLLCPLFSLVSASAPPAIYSLSLHDALPISAGLALHHGRLRGLRVGVTRPEQTLSLAVSDGNPIPARGNQGRHQSPSASPRSEEHTSELQSRENLVCRLLLEKKNTIRDDRSH